MTFLFTVRAGPDPEHRLAAVDKAALGKIEHLLAVEAGLELEVIARSLLVKLRGRAESLDATPMRGTVVPELGHFGVRSWRELVVKPYRIIFRVAEAEVFVLAVFDGRRDLEDVLLERLVRSREP